MKKFFRTYIDIRQGELNITLLLLANIYIILLAYYFLKPARDSLFLVKLGAEQLPYVFILTAIVIVPITTFYSWASRSLKLNRLINYTLFILILCLFGLRYLMTLPYDWVPYVFYTWVSIYGALSTSQFWVLANAVYTATQAKRLFAFLALGGIFGAWTGGEVTSIIIKIFNVSTEDLLLFCVGFLAISIILTTTIWNVKKKEIEQSSRKQKKGTEQKESFLQMFSSIKKSKHLLLIAGIISITMMVASLVDFQFKAVSTEYFKDAVSGEVNKSELTAFLGTFYGRLSLISILLQLVVAQRFLRLLGVGGVILFLPIGLLLGSVAMFAYIGLITAVILRGSDGALKYSLDKTGRELLFLPVPLDLKKRTKVFIDMFVDRSARGLSGALLLLLINVFNYETNPIQAIRLMSLVVIGFLAVWIILALVMRKEYVNTFRVAIEKRQINLDEIRQQINESSTIDILIASLKSNNEREICYALGMLSGVKNELLLEPLKRLLNHESDEVRLSTIKLLKNIEDNSMIPDIKKFLDDKNSDIRIEAMHYLYQHLQNDSHEMLITYLNHPKVIYQVAAVSCIAEYGDSELKLLITEDLISKLLNDKSENREEILSLTASALGKLGNRNYSQFIVQLLNNSSGKVVNEVIKCISLLRDREYVVWLLNALADKKYRFEARQALASFGEGVVGTLNDYLVDDKTNWEIRKNIPGVLSLIHEQASIDILLRALPRSRPNLKYFIVKALNRLRNNCQDLKIHSKQIDDALILETKNYYELSQILIKQNDNDLPEGRLLKRALEEKLDDNLEIIFRLLGLNYSSKDIFSAYKGIVSDIASQRASAVEFLDNLLKKDVKKYLYPIVDEDSPERIIKRGQELFGIKKLGKEESIINLINGNDRWLKALAIFNTQHINSDAITKRVENQLNDSDPVVRETAEFVLNKQS